MHSYDLDPYGWLIAAFLFVTALVTFLGSF